MKLTLDITKEDFRALRRAVSSLYEGELARHPFRKRLSLLAQRCERLMGKLDAAATAASEAWRAAK
jgi:hypothetical protein